MRGMYAGWHLTMDCLVESQEAVHHLGDRAFLDMFLCDLVALLKMNVLGGPHMYEVLCDPLGDDDGGLTGAVVLSTSHLSIHTWPLRKCFSLDVFSCKEFEEEVVQALARERFGVVSRASHWIVRNWP